MPTKLSLEQKVAERLKQTNLVSEAEFHLAEDYQKLGRTNQNDDKTESMPYLTFQFTKKRAQRDCSQFTGYLLKQLRQTKPEIIGISYDRNNHRKGLNAYLILNPQADILDKTDFVTETLNTLNTALKNYLYQNHIPDPLRK